MKDKIVDILKDHTEGVTITQLTSLLGMSRLSTTKYLHELIGEDRVRIRRVGMAKLIYLKKKSFLSRK